MTSRRYTTRRLKIVQVCRRKLQDVEKGHLGKNFRGQGQRLGPRNVFEMPFSYQGNFSSHVDLNRFVWKIMTTEALLHI